MGMMRFVAGAIIVGAVVAYGESDAPAPSEAAQVARSAAGFCKDRPELCAAAAGSAARSGLDQLRTPEAKPKVDRSR